MQKVAFLPLYVKLYDDIGLDVLRQRLEGFYETCAGWLEQAGLAVRRLPVCREKAEFEAALQGLEGVDVLVTLHLAYSPSLESIDALRRCPVPIIALDTTPDETLAGDDFVMPNHGIHGVQDMCSLLARHGVQASVVAGPPRPQLARRVARLCGLLAAARRFKNSRVGRMGRPFPGMGDFLVEAGTLQKDLGIKTVQFNFDKAGSYRPTVAEIEAEYARDRKCFEVAAPWDEDYRASLEAGLMLRRWVEVEKLDAVTFTFFDITRACGVPRVPFWEASKLMAQGVGYAGEGDTLTAALVGALLGVWPTASFAEMFCPDWQRDLIFLSHMGEINTAVCEAVRVEKKPYDFSDCGDVACGFGCFKPGQAVYVSLTPTQHGYRLVAGAVQMVAPPLKTPGTVAGWMKPEKPVAQFLEAFSRLAGTHHGMVLYGATCEELAVFARAAQLEYCVIQ